MSTFNTRIRQRRDTEANWVAQNPVLLAGEMITVVRTDGSEYIKIGDGTSTYSALPFVAGDNAAYTTTASGDYSHSEGYNTQSTNTADHAEGYGTMASGGYGAHAEGRNTTASGTRSHAEGYGTTAASANQHVEGKYNTADSEGAYAHIVGNGAGSTATSNAHTLDWSGNAWFAGDVFTGGTEQSEGEQLATQTYVAESIQNAVLDSWSASY